VTIGVFIVFHGNKIVGLVTDMCTSVVFIAAMLCVDSVLLFIATAASVLFLPILPAIKKRLSIVQHFSC
jgi:ABC-type bacteriocin/lantibiotic exporter with double-glycine peptidase domain